MQPAELPSSTLLSYAVPFWNTLHLLSNAAPYWATGPSTELRCTLLSYAVSTKQPSVPYLCAIFVKCWNVGLSGTGKVCTQVRYQNATVPAWVAGCRNTDAGGIGLDAHAQLWLSSYVLYYYGASKAINLLM
jgi:hypothetical protein